MHALPTRVAWRLDQCGQYAALHVACAVSIWGVFCRQSPDRILFFSRRVETQVRRATASERKWKPITSSPATTLRNSILGLPSFLPFYLCTSSVPVHLHQIAHVTPKHKRPVVPCIESGAHVLHFVQLRSLLLTSQSPSSTAAAAARTTSQWSIGGAVDGRGLNYISTEGTALAIKGELYVHI